MRDLNDKVTGGTLTAAEWNEVPSEIQNVIEGLGIALSGADLNQLGKAIAGYVANGTFYTDSGAADAYVLTTIGSKQSLTAYTDGATFEFTTTNANTGASTVNVAALGVKNIKLADGTDPTAGQLDGRVILKFDAGNDRCELIQSGMVNSIIFTAGGTYTPPAGLKGVKFTAIGAGGGGGGVDGSGAATSAASGGGGSGSASILTTPNIESSYAIVIGAGGVGGAGTGGVGGASGGTTTVISVVVSLSAGGAGGGAGHVGTSGNNFAGGGTGGVATGGDLNISGGDATSGLVVAGDPASGGDSGGSLFGGVKRVPSAGTGRDGSVFGSGGSGIIAENISTDFNGGTGADGVVIIEEFF